ncbi:CPBP family intramembrane metalloprotease [Hymenobacter sp. 15J16-1T3B]|uniref:CPBP family intramembrane glutamic endopeptidase n=1 Tax=Hymenobacter sp. 15J16-1T3B TaxID=2886941 RepID=UPI001D11F876|nr:type II CAAX endopeptidase family protein [Hymenobacter sp. 15J16-1T3B]MCC3155975.1 CPBP family intramembrane metalloprotease [Hymenobacter sp. 15J16-1T3B]
MLPTRPARPTDENLHPALVLMLLVLLVVGGMCVGFFVAMLLVGAVYGMDALMRVTTIIAAPQSAPEGWGVLMIMQGVPLLFGFGGGALLVPVVRGLKPAAYFQPRQPVPAFWLLAAMALIIVSIPAMSVLIAWNAGLHLPPSLYGLEKAARLYEDQAQVLTTFLTKFNSFGRFLVALLVVAVIPAIAEELTFRGVVLRQLARWTGSVHWGVWLSAAVFSAIHVQFFGFFPRLLLGVVLGYLFAWSGNIRVSMAAHFAQNGFQLLLLYLQQRGTISFDADGNEALPWPLALVSLLITGGLLYWLYQQRFQLPAAAAQPLEAHTLTGHGVEVRRADVPPVAGHTLTGHGIDTPRTDQPGA